MKNFEAKTSQPAFTPHLPESMSSGFQVNDFGICFNPQKVIYKVHPLMLVHVELIAWSLLRRSCNVIG